MIKARPKYPTNLHGTIYIDNIQKSVVICLIIPTIFPQHLNRCIVQACNIPSVRNMMCTADQVVKFFEYSPKKQTVFEKLIDETVNDDTSRTKLKQLCRTSKGGMARCLFCVSGFFSCYCSDPWALYKTAKHTYTRSSWCNFFAIFYLLFWVCRRYCYCANVLGFYERP